MKYKFSKLALKFIFGFVILGILICGTSSTIGYYQYKSVIQKQYNDTAYQVAEVARSYVDLETIEKYAEIVQGYRAGTVTDEEIQAYRSEESYQEIISRFADLRKGMGANDIFIATVDRQQLESFDGSMEGWSPMLYIFDCYADASLSFLLGDSSPFNPEFMEDVTALFNTGVRPDNYFISESAFGYNTSAQLAIMNDAGEVIAAVGVEIPMSTIQAALNQYSSTPSWSPCCSSSSSSWFT